MGVHANQDADGMMDGSQTLTLSLFYRIIVFDFIVAVQMLIHLKCVMYVFVMYDKCDIKHQSKF